MNNPKTPFAPATGSRRSASQAAGPAGMKQLAVPAEAETGAVCHICGGPIGEFGLCLSRYLVSAGGNDQAERPE